jgi:quinol monooxygenase YgiN
MEDTMVVIAGSLTFSPADRDDVVASLTEITKLSRRDAGCVEYWWAEDLGAPNTFRFFECWATQEDFDNHIGAPHEKAFGERNLTRIVDATATMFRATPAS